MLILAQTSAITLEDVKKTTTPTEKHRKVLPEAVIASPNMLSVVIERPQ